MNPSSSSYPKGAKSIFVESITHNGQPAIKAKNTVLSRLTICEMIPTMATHRKHFLVNGSEKIANST
jgi:hypothetical protein